jgi:RHS repeat-associated protein
VRCDREEFIVVGELQRRLVRLLPILFALAPCLAMAGGDHAQAMPDPHHAPSIWVSTGDGLLKLSAADGSEMARVTYPPHGFDVVAVDAVHARVWTAADGLLHAYDIAGNPVLATDLTERGGGPAGLAIALAVDGRSGDVYLLEADRLLRLDGDGILLGVHEIDTSHGDASALTLAHDGIQLQVWIATAARVIAWDAHGHEVAALDTDLAVRALAWDEVAGVLYLADGERVQRYRTGGGLEDSIPFDGAVVLVPDARGGVWIASHVRLVHADASGGLSRHRHLPPEIHGALRAAAADASHGLWLAGTQRLRHVDDNGEMTLQFEPAGRPPLHDLAFYADRTPPHLTIVAPPSGIRTSDTEIGIHLEWHDDGIGVNPESLAARIAGGADVPLALNCTADGAQGFCLPAVPWTDGHWPLDFTIADFAGNRSLPAALDLNIDTVVPAPPDAAPDAPADPAVVAPPPLRGVANPLMQLESFLFEGANPIQRDTDAHQFDARRFAVVRGRVTDADGAPIAGVTVSVLQHPEYGHTQTRADGEYDLAVNGGGEMTLDFTRNGLLPAQRQVQVPWRDYVYADDVALIPLDDRVTVVDLGSGVDMQIARGSVQTDADGARQATVLFPAGTVATITNEKGEVLQLSRLSFRATEYTVGERGPQMMPGELPPASGYTYAVELSADEALAAGARTIRFNHPVPLYVENFLQFPTGSGVPAGFYDRGMGQWIPSANGRVIEILSVDDGRATLDVSGNGIASEAELDAMGIEVAERARLAALYAPGDTLWRTPLPHFSPWDLNFPFGPPEGAQNPPAPPAHVDVPDDERAQCGGCIISPQDQNLAKELPVIGTPFTLRYDSKRQPGYARSRRMEIPLTGNVIHSDLRRVEVTVTVAGRVVRRAFEALPHQSWTFEWDGRDVRGRALTDPVTATVQVDHVYPMLYRVPDWQTGRFGSPPASIEVNERGRFTFGETQTRQRWTQRLLPPEPVRVARAAGLGGWTLNRQHAYIGVAGAPDRLEYGDGRSLAPAGTAPIIETVAGAHGRPLGFSGDGGDAIDAAFRATNDVTVTPDGSLYIADLGNALRRVAPDGVVESLALPDALGSNVWRVAAGPDGAIYFSDPRSVFRIGRNGDITTIAGSGSFASTGDGGPAIEAAVVPEDIAVGPDGAVYIVDMVHRRVRRVAPDGIIETIAGTGVFGFSGDGGPAMSASFMRPRGIAVGPDGSLYIADELSHRVRRVGPDGIIDTIAGSGSVGFRMGGFSGDGGHATEAQLEEPFRIALATDGTLYISDTRNNRVRGVGPHGIIETVAGTGESGFSGDGGPPTAAQIAARNALAVGPSGALYLTGVNYVRRVDYADGLASGAPRVAATNGTEVHVFDERGQHVSTLDAAVGATRWSYAYDSADQLVSITDTAGDVTRIERDAVGVAHTIVAPDGQRTQLAIDQDGRLAQVTDPAGATIQMSYDRHGLLTSFVDGNGGESRFVYSELGELIEDADAAGGGWTLARTATAGAVETVMETAEGRTHRFRVESLPGGGRRLVDTTPDGLDTISVYEPDRGRLSILGADGVEYTLQQEPDPRFGMQSPVPAQLSLTMPSGRTLQAAASRTVLLMDDADFFSLDTWIENVTVGAETWTAKYDGSSRTLSQSTPEGRMTNVAFDLLSRPLRVQVAGLAPWHLERDDRGRLIAVTQGEGQSVRETRFAYGGDGLLAAVTDPLGRRVEFEHDPAGRLTRQTWSDGRAIDFQWDAQGDLRAIVPPDRDAHRFTYTPVGLDATYVPPELPGFDATTHYTWNRDRQLTRVDRPDGRSLLLDYDAGGRLATRTSPGDAVTFEYDPASGRLVRLSNAAGASIEYRYDGPLLLSESWDGDVAGTVHRDYDDQLRLGELVVGKHSVRIHYDRDNLPIRVGRLDLHRDAATGLPAGTTLGMVVTHLVRNAFAEPESLTVRFGDTPLHTVAYVRDGVGRIVEKTEAIDGRSPHERYEYDARGRLHRVFRDGSLASVYDYDANGNRLARNTTFGSFDAQDRLLTWGDVEYAYNEAGELTEMRSPAGISTFDYDIAGNLRRVAMPDGRVIEYVVDARDRRIGRKVDGSLQWGLIYQDQLNPVARVDGDGLIDQAYVYASRPNVPDYLIDADDSTYRLVADHLGSVRLVVNADTGEVIQRLDYDEFGRVLHDSNPGFQPFGFAGGLYDADTGLVRFGSRDYDPETGRWTAKDPIGFWGNDSGLYSYAYNDPVNHLDLTGEIGLLGAGVGAIIGGVSSGIGTFTTTGSFSEAAASALTGAVAGALTGALPGAGLIRSVMLGGGLAGVSNALAQGFGIVRNPCASSKDFNVGAVAGAAIGGSIIAARSFPAGKSLAAQVAFAPSDLGISATSTGIGNAIGNR